MGEIIQTQFNELTEKIGRLEEEHSQQINELKKEIRELRDPPVFFQCVFKAEENTNEKAVQYEREVYSRTNQFTVDGGMDLSSGIFTSPYPGTYTFTHSLYSHNENEDPSYLHLRKNGDSIPESLHYSDIYMGNEPGGVVSDQGGRTMILHLSRGETVDLYCNKCIASVKNIVLCVQLSQFDVE